MRPRSLPATGLSLSLALILGTSSTTQAQEASKGAARRLSEMFADLDVDRDGVLDPKEIDASERPAFAKLLEHGDANRDGRIDSGEFDALSEKVVAARKAGPARPKQKSEPKASTAAKPAEVEKPEARPAAPADPRIERLKTLLERLRAQDADEDGRLSREEFRGRPAAFDRLDADKDGFLDRSDLKALRDKRPGGPRPARPKQPGSAG